jgi:predicted  nucleic acid-binding Zn-ribbon protein
MTDPRADSPLNVVDTLLMPLRLPGRVVSDIETLTKAVVALQSDAKRHLSSVDDRAGQLIDGLSVLHKAVGRIELKVNALEEERMEAFLNAVDKLQDSIDRIEQRVVHLDTLEATITDQIQGLRHDLDERMNAVRAEVQAMHPPLVGMADDVAKIDDLLPDPKDGPLTRLKDTFTSS